MEDVVKDTLYLSTPKYSINHLQLTVHVFLLADHYQIEIKSAKLLTV